MNPTSARIPEPAPVLILKVGRYPLSHGVLGAIRSLGRAGVSVHAICDDHFVPYAFSRYLSGGFLLPETDYRDRGSDLLPHLVRLAGILQTKAVLLPTDDEAAIFTAEHAGDLRQHYYVPNVDPVLPRLLASKYQLSRLCLQHGVPIPSTQFVRSKRDVLALADKVRYPIVVKNSEPWIRLRAAAVGATTIVESRDALLLLASRWGESPRVIFQEYIPHEVAEDWVFHAYLDRASRPLVAFTGVKQRSWPPHAGVTAAAIAVPNEALVGLAASFCQKIGYRGIVDMDWRYDRRDNQYKLVDCNPRLGANFALFVTDSALDVVRAQYLDLTGQQVGASAQSFGRRLIVENLYLASSLFPATIRASKNPPPKCSCRAACPACRKPRTNAA